MSWYEVESKIRVDDEKEMRKKIKKIARFVKKEVKRDTYYAIVKSGYPKKAFRIRKVKDDWVMNFKIWVKKYWDKHIVVKEEFEIELENKNSFLEFLRDLNFRKWVEKVKHCETYRTKEGVTIELSKVVGLGWFMEIEVLSTKKKILDAKKKIRKVFGDLGIKGYGMIDNTGYTKMLWRKRK